MTKIYGINNNLIIVEENGVILEEIDCINDDVYFEMSDGTVILFQYSIKKIKVWSVSIIEEGYGEYEIEEYDEEISEYKSDSIEIDAEYCEHRFN